MSWMLLIATGALIFRARGQDKFGDGFALIAWGIFTAILLHGNGWWMLADFIITASLFTLGARPSWRNCWPAWQSDAPYERAKGTLNSLVRSLWFWPLLFFVGLRGDSEGWCIIALSFFFSLAWTCIFRWGDAWRSALKLPDTAQWVFQELLLGALIMITQIILVG